ncbi:hypothetical protein JL100_003060 [Skermanella mucosa]|uniref:hypothetical protein n=1 Tax=Skermanella mucosa TaxID=1789672 RepID=UPI00192C227B|nr:hypothetical protein [Skermanella mucosa]UEM21761.1 hypothetical protein JL100_003060 [Skermanella mucosa]
MADPRGQLYAIERTLRRRGSKPGVKPGAREQPAPKRQRADTDAPIDLRYPAHPGDAVMPPEPAPPAAGLGFAAGLGAAPTPTAFDLVATALSDGSTAFQVEAFDAPARPAKPAGCCDACAGRTRALADEEEVREEPAEAPPDPPEERAEERVEEPPAEYVFPESAGLGLDEDPETRRFNEDLKAILSGQRSHPSVEPRPVPVPPPGDEPADARPVAAPAAAFGHEIFDRLGASMARATTFDLGSMAIERSLDEFDRRMAAEERSPGPPAAALSVSDLDFAEDLSLIMGSAGSPAETETAEDAAG